MNLNRQSASKVRRIANAQEELANFLDREARWDGNGSYSCLEPDEKLEAVRRLYFDLRREREI